MRRNVLLSVVLLAALGFCLGAETAVAIPRIKDISRVGTDGELRLIGYGLVVGLDGTGDSKGTEFTVQSVTNMLNRMGITVPQNKVKTKNVAAVIASAEMPLTARVGTRIDVTVSSLGDAKSLEGGTLLLSPLKGTDNKFYATAQGPVHSMTRGEPSPRPTSNRMPRQTAGLQSNLIVTGLSLRKVSSGLSPWVLLVLV